jgi:hypothetical protein
MGVCALFSNTTTGSHVAIGHCALALNTGGGRNVAVGLVGLCSNTTGNLNVAVGGYALYSNTIGDWNTAVGDGAMDVNTSGSCNTAVGLGSLGVLTTGCRNTSIGANSGQSLTTGCSNVLIGYAAPASSSSVSNEVTIYNGTNYARFQGAAVAWTFTSDARKKEKIQDLPVGLNFVNKLQPRTFDWKETGAHSAGFIAQEVDEVVQSHSAEYLGVVNKDDPECYGVAGAALVPVLVKAIQELSAKVTELEEKLASNG